MEYFIADAHCDFLYSMVNYGQDIGTLQGNQAIHLPFLRKGGVKLQFFAAWMDRQQKMPYLQQCISMIDAYYRILEHYPQDFTPFTKDYDPQIDPHIATVLTIEGGEAIEGSLAVLRTVYRLGVRAMTLTWNHHNELAYAALKRGGKGLTALGKEAVAEMGRLGIAVDVAHLNDAGIDDVLAIATRPVFASHSNARALCDTPRALQDAHIKAIADQGGVVGVNFFHKQLTNTGEASIHDIVRHVEHVAKVGGVKCCAIGSDFDGMNEYPVDLKNSGDLQKLIQGLLEVGFTQEEVARIAYGNLRDYMVQFV